MYTPGSPLRALKHSDVSSTSTWLVRGRRRSVRCCVAVVGVDGAEIGAGRLGSGGGNGMVKRDGGHYRAVCLFGGELALFTRDILWRSLQLW
jgi:hypothetical protein